LEVENSQRERKRERDMAEDSEGTAKKEEILESQIETAMRSRVSLFKEQSE